MPLITLEATSNITPFPMVKSILQKVHFILVEYADANLQSCKSKFIQHDSFLIGEGDPNQAFVQLSIKLLEGRTEKQLKDVGQKTKQVLHDSLMALSVNTQITVQIQIMPEDLYFKDL